MSLVTSLYTGTTGLDSSSTDLSVIGDNIANANTVGFKAGRTAFEDALAQNLIGTGQVGLGTRVQTVQKILSQGALTNTGQATDLALEGSGYFVVNGSHDGISGNFYTRAGQFTVDKDGFLVNLAGLKVQGYPADQTGAIGGAPGDLMVGNASSAPNPTTTLTVKANLQSDVAPVAAWDINNAAATSNFSSSTTAYDSLGAAHAVDIFYRRTGTGTWEWHALSDGAGITGGTAGTPEQVAGGTLAFDSSGRLTAVTQASTFNPRGAVNPQPLTFNLGDPTGAGGTGLTGLTQFASPSSTTFISQDGYSSGSVASIAIDSTGKVVGSFTNGQTRNLGQIIVASFPAPDQLQRIGANLYSATVNNVGQPAIGAPGEGGRGSIVAGALEQSNVDLATEFVRMIAAQRGFQANSKTITTADSLLQELMNLKR